MAKSKTTFQTHHIVYHKDEPVPEWTVRMTKGEHWAVTQIQRFKSFTDGMVRALLYEVATKPRRTEDES